ncbi:MAG: hypothetical protein RL701_3703 [Pseudomonadota bacterium]|jgi:hypothetical protein
MTSHKLIALLQVLLALLVLGGVWLGLPARWLWVDVPATALGLACIGVAIGLWTNAPWSLRAARLLLWTELALGSLCVTLLGLSAAQLAGSYGAVGGGGALLLVIVAALVLPYLVVFPALQLRHLRKLG